jgi:hypothetical protein
LYNIEIIGHVRVGIDGIDVGENIGSCSCSELYDIGCVEAADRVGIGV